MPKKLPPCPLCGKKLPYDCNAGYDSRGVLVRFRECACGYSRLERVTTAVEEYFPDADSPPVGSGPEAALRMP